MTKRVKLVTMISRPGATDSTVSSAEHLDDVADGGAVGLAEAAEVDLLGHRRRAAERQRRQCAEKPSHSNSSVLISTALTWPSLRIAARSARSALRCWKPLAPSIWCIFTVRTKASRSWWMVSASSGVGRRRVEHDVQFQAQPDVARRGQIGGDRRQRQHERIAVRRGFAVLALALLRLAVAGVLGVVTALGRCGRGIGRLFARHGAVQIAAREPADPDGGRRHDQQQAELDDDRRSGLRRLFACCGCHCDPQKGRTVSRICWP